MKTMSQLREMLSEEIDSIRDKKTTPGAVNAICNATGKFLSTIKLEMEFVKMFGKEPSTDFVRLMDKTHSDPQVTSRKKAA